MVARQCPMRPRCAHTNGVTENSASLTRRRLYAGAGVRHRRRSAAHLHRLLCPRRCRGLTEDVTARAVRQRLWSSGVPPARRQQGRVESRHAALRSAYRVMAECRRSATMSAVMWGWRDRLRGRGAAALLWHRGVVMLARRGATLLFGNPVRIAQRSVRGHRVRPHHQRAGGTPLCARR